MPLIITGGYGPETGIYGSEATDPGDPKSFTGPGLFLYSISQPALRVLRVMFGQDPRKVSESGPTDGLNPSNYSLSGPTYISITGVGTVSGDTQSLDLYLGAQLPIGEWTLTATNVESDTGTPLVNPKHITFSITQFNEQKPLNVGSENLSAQSYIQRLMPPAFGRTS